MAFVSALGYVYSKIVRPVVGRVKEINDTVLLLSTNHLPHIQASLNRQDDVLKVLVDESSKSKVEIEACATRQIDMKKSIDTIGEALLTHLNNTSLEKRRARKK